MKKVFIYDDNYSEKYLKGVLKDKIYAEGFEKPELNKIEVILNNISEYKDIDGYIIPCSLGSIHTKYYGITLGLHIRLSEKLGRKRFLPILFLSYDKYEEIAMFDEMNITKFLLLKGSKLSDFNSIDNLISKFADIDSFDLTRAETDLSLDLKNYVLDKISVPMPYNKDRHSIANEWGIQRLSWASNIPVSGTILQDLYLKYELAKVPRIEGEGKKKVKIKKKIDEFITRYYNNQKKINILLIDNEADKGWFELIQKLFTKPPFEPEKCNVSPDMESNEYEEKFFSLKTNNSYTLCFVCVKSFEKAKDILDENLENWDLILLDLRLLDNDNNILCPKSISEFSGGELLKLIKSENPSIPVILFTATNKAWNYVMAINEGVEGFYMKESPEFGIDNKFTLENYDNFIESIINSFQNGPYLKWFWNHICELTDHLKSKPSKNEYSINVNKRIIDKLYLAFGLLRNRIRRFDFEKREKFVVCDFGLAFITLWSCLNEIAVEKIPGDVNDNEKSLLHILEKYIENKDKDLYGKHLIIKDIRNNIDFIHPSPKNIRTFKIKNEIDVSNLAAYEKYVLESYKQCADIFKLLYIYIKETDIEDEPGLVL